MRPCRRIDTAGVAVEAMGQRDNTLVIYITGDNGPFRLSANTGTLAPGASVGPP